MDHQGAEGVVRIAQSLKVKPVQSSGSLYVIREREESRIPLKVLV